MINKRCGQSHYVKKVAFNALYISDALKNFDSDNMIFCMNQPLTSARLIEEGREEFIYVVTPVRTAH